MINEMMETGRVSEAERGWEKGIEKGGGCRKGFKKHGQNGN